MVAPPQQGPWSVCRDSLQETPVPAQLRSIRRVVLEGPAMSSRSLGESLVPISKVIVPCWDTECAGAICKA